MKILVATKNQKKLDAVKESFLLYYKDLDIIGVPVNSMVSDQPLENETFEGARNRAKALQKINKEQSLAADFFVGIEGGIIKLNNTQFNSNVACIIDKESNVGTGISPVFELPNFVKDKLSKGIELGQIIDELSNQEKSGHKGGAVDFFSKGKINRKEMTKLALMMALIPIINKKSFALE